MTEIDRRARIAGGLYLLTLPLGVFSLMYVPGRMVVAGNPAATIVNILANESLYRWGIAGEIAGAALWVIVVAALYRLFADVDRFQAWLMVGLGVMAAPVMLLNVLSEMAVLTVIGDPGFAAAFSPAQVQKLAWALQRSHGQGFTLLLVFSGVWLFPYAALVWRSGFLPRWLAVLLTLGGLGYLASGATALLSPPLYRLIDPVASLVSFLGETPAMFWLLLAGAKVRPAASGTTGAAPAGA